MANKWHSIIYHKISCLCTLMQWKPEEWNYAVHNPRHITLDRVSKQSETPHRETVTQVRSYRDLVSALELMIFMAQIYKSREEEVVKAGGVLVAELNRYYDENMELKNGCK